MKNFFKLSSYTKADAIKELYGLDKYYIRDRVEYQIRKGDAPENLTITEDDIEQALVGRGKLPYFSKYVDFNNSIRILIKWQMKKV